MEILELIHSDVKEGFAQVNLRLDALNGRVRTHGEKIAVLDHAQNGFAHRLEDVDRHITEHQLMCPALQNANEIKKAQNKRASIVAAIASGVTIGLTEVLPRIKEFFAGFVQ
jgi:hypothetical protein